MFCKVKMHCKQWFATLFLLFHEIAECSNDYNFTYFSNQNYFLTYFYCRNLTMYEKVERHVDISMLYPTLLRIIVLMCGSS